MDARNQPPDDQKRRKQSCKSTDSSSDCGAFASPVNLQLQRWHDAQHQQRCGGGIRGLQPTLDPNRTVVDGNSLEKQIAENDEGVITPQQKDIRIDLPQVFSPEELDQAESAKAEADADRYKAEPIGYRVKVHVYAGQTVKPQVERRKADFSSVWSCFLYVDQQDQNRPQRKCEQVPKPCPQVFPRFLIHFLFPPFVCAYRSAGPRGWKETCRHIGDTKRVTPAAV